MGAWMLPAHVCAGRPAEQPAVRRAVVVLVEERQQARLHVVQRGHRAEVVEAALARSVRQKRSILPRAGAS